MLVSAALSSRQKSLSEVVEIRLLGADEVVVEPGVPGVAPLAGVAAAPAAGFVLPVVVDEIELDVTRTSDCP